jgi:hypothetical protein
VNAFVAEPMRNGVAGVTGVLFSVLPSSIVLIPSVVHARQFLSLSVTL